MYCVLIVDDEHIIRKGLRYVIPWESIGFKVVHEAASGEEALIKLSNTHIDVAIIDINMPGMNGLDLISNIKKLFPHIKTIIISGYNDFNYSVTALRMKVSDYILKPINKDDIIAAFTDLKQKLDDEQRQSGIVQARESAAGKLFLQRILNNDFINQEELLAYCMKYGISFPLDSYCILVVRIKEFAEFIKEHYRNSRQRFEEHLDTLLGKSLYESGMNEKKVLSVIIGDNFAVMVPSKDSERLSEQFSQYIREITDDFHIGIGKENNELNYMNVSFLQALESITKRIENILICNSDVGKNKKDLDPSRKMYLSKMVIEKFDEGKFEELDNTIEHIFDELYDSDMNTIFNWCVNSIYSIIDYFSINSFSSKKIISDFDILAISSEFSVKSIKSAYKDKLTKIKELLGSLQAGSVEYIVKRVCDIANEEFSDSSLSLQEIATRLNISYGYLSTAFKQIKGENFSAYLANIKMNYARKLIIEGNYKMNEIAELAGYSSARYFTDQFRKYFGVSPTDYKCRLLKK